MKSTRYFIFSVVLVLSLQTLAFSQVPKDVIMRAVEDEMTRAMKDLKFKTFDKPYFLEYVVEDVDSLAIQGSFGALRNSVRSRNRILLTQVRVGDYDLDNARGFAFRVPFSMPIDGDYNALRRSVWFITDRSYKQAINMFEAVKAQKKDNPSDDEEDRVPSFSKEKPVVSIGKILKLDVDKKAWEKRVRDWSAMFRQYPEFRDSSVNFYVRQANRYLVNTEGTRVLEPSLLITYDIHARGVSSEGYPTDNYRHIFATSFDQVPSTEEISREIEGLVKDLKKYEAAKPFKETYIGPALFAEGSAVQLFHQLLTPNLTGGEFADRIGRKVLPTFLSVADDPTKTKFGEFELAGNYKIDDEGVPAKPVKLIENGILKTLLTTRRPLKEVKRSNGRARGSGFRGSGASISNLLITAREGKTLAELKQRLIDECKDLGLEYGVMFRENNATYSSFTGGTSVLVYKVYVKDGREELYRDASVSQLSIRELRNIIAAGEKTYPFNFLINSSYNGNGTPASIVAPSVILDEIQLKKSRQRKEKPKYLKHPYFDK